MVKSYEFRQVLNLPMDVNDANAKNIGQYLIRLAQQCWIEEESFDGKRPYGNSGWQSDVIKAFIKHEVIDGRLDEYEDLEEYDKASFDRIVARLFEILLTADYSKIEEYKEPEDWYVVYLGLDASGTPKMIDSYWLGRTQEAAEMEAVRANEADGKTRWQVVHIPE